MGAFALGGDLLSGFAGVDVPFAVEAGGLEDALELLDQVPPGGGEVLRRAGVGYDVVDFRRLGRMGAEGPVAAFALSIPARWVSVANMVFLSLSVSRARVIL